MENHDINLNDAVLASLMLLKPVLVTSNSPQQSMDRICGILSMWPGLQPSITFAPSTSGFSLFIIENSDINDQLTIYKTIRRNKYPLILLRTEDSYLCDKLKSQILFEFQDDITKTFPILNWTSSLEEKRIEMSKVMVTTEVQTYIYDLVVELRYSRFIKGGIPSYVLFDLMSFVKFWAFTSGMKFATPLICKECMKIVLPLRIHLITPEEDPTLIYGSDITLVTQLIGAITVEDAIDIAIAKVRPPI